MSKDRVVPNQGHELEMGGIKLFIAPAFDTLMYFEPLDAHWLRYYDGEDGQMKMVVLQERLAKMVLEQTDTPYCVRETVTTLEHEHLVDTLGQWVVDSFLD